MILCMICWGSWANSYKLTKDYRFELFYWDYAIGIFVVSLIWAFTLGSTGASGERVSDQIPDQGGDAQSDHRQPGVKDKIP